MRSWRAPSTARHFVSSGVGGAEDEGEGFYDVLPIAAKRSTRWAMRSMASGRPSTQSSPTLAISASNSGLRHHLEHADAGDAAAREDRLVDGVVDPSGELRRLLLEHLLDLLR